jgi:ABC-2 type transport system permease protein
MTSRVATAMVMGLREFRRTPVLLALLVVLPLYFIGAFMYIVPTETLPIEVAGDLVSVPLTDLVAVLMTPLTAGLLSGIVGLFLMQSSKAADDRLRLAGYRSRDLVASRVGLLGVGGVVVSSASLAVVLLGFTPRSIPAFVAATVLTALTYGIIGVIIGISLNRLSGVYVILFAPFVDMLLFQSPMGSDAPVWVTVLPGYFVTRATMDAAFTTGLDVTNFAGALGYALILTLVGIVVFYRVTTLN